VLQPCGPSRPLTGIALSYGGDGVLKIATWKERSGYSVTEIS
jgi:hypothetical protein